MGRQRRLKWTQERRRRRRRRRWWWWWRWRPTQTKGSATVTSTTETKKKEDDKGSQRRRRRRPLSWHNHHRSPNHVSISTNCCRTAPRSCQAHGRWPWPHRAGKQWKSVDGRTHQAITQRASKSAGWQFDIYLPRTSKSRGKADIDFLSPRPFACSLPSIKLLRKRGHENRVRWGRTS